MSNQIRFELRAEQPQDYRETEVVVREAFWNHYSPGCSEHYLVHIMREHPKFVPELDTVAIHEGKVIGNVMFLKNTLQADDGKIYEVLGLGPIAVLPKYQGEGVGGKLIAYTKELAQSMGYRAIFLFGDPDYYSRQGFMPTEQFGIRTADNMYAAAHLVFPLHENALSGITGRYLEDPVYEVDEKAVLDFDTNFPEKERLSDTAPQLRFQKLVAMRKKA